MSIGRIGVAVLALASLAMAGCNGQETAPVRGTVTADGEPVDAGTVIFQPQGEGYPATGDVQSDGSYALSFSEGEGAVVGEYHVRYLPPRPEETEEGGTAPPSQWRDWELAEGYTASVEPGENDIPLELVRK